jgi:hypothetical protein
MNRPSRKARALAVFVVAFALWPLMQRGLVWTYDVNPWKLGGWAMYSAPVLRTDLLIVGAEGDTAVRVDPRRLSEDTRHAYDNYFYYTRHLGRLVDGDELARGVLQDAPSLREVMLVIVRRRISPRTGLVEITDERQVYERSKLGILF